VIKVIHQHRRSILLVFTLAFVFLMPPIVNVLLRPLRGSEWFFWGRLVVTDLCVAFAFLLFKEAWIRSKESLLLLGILIAIRLSIAFSANVTSTMAGEYLKFTTASFLFFFFSFSSTWVNPKKLLQILIVGLTVLGTVEAVWALTQYLMQGDLGLRWLGERAFGVEIPGSAIIEYSQTLIVRSYGNFDHPNALGGCLVVSMLTTCALFWQNPSFFVRSFLVVSLCLESLALVTTYSRSAWIASIIGVVIWLMQLFHHSQGTIKERWVHLRPIVAVITLAGVLCGLCFHGEIASRLRLKKTSNITQFSMQIVENLNLDSGRVIFQEVAEKMIRSNPFKGVGFSSFVKKMDRFLIKDQQLAQHLPVHNIYYLLAAETGIPNLVLFILFLFCLLKGVKEFPLSPFHAILVTVLLIGWFDNYFFTMQAGRLLFFIICGGIILQRQGLRRETAFA